MDKFIPNTLGLKIHSKEGKYSDFAGIAYIGMKKTYSVKFDNSKSLECTEDHKLMTPNGRIEISNLHIGDEVFQADGKITKILSIIHTGNTEPVYDIVEVRDNHQYVINGIQSSNCNFITDEETLIDPLCLSRLTSIDPEFYTQQVRWYIEPIPNKTYLIAMDPSLGTGGDFAAIQVFMLPELIQVAEWQNNKTDCRGQVRILLQILHSLYSDLSENPEQHGEPELFWTVENNTIGEAVLQVIFDTGEEKFPGTMVNEKKKKGQTRRFRKGLTTTNASKLSSCARMKSLIESDRMIINSIQTIRELKNFISHRKSYAAKSGQTDDLISSILLIVRMLDIIINMGIENVSDDLKETITDDDIWGDDPMPIVV